MCVLADDTLWLTIIVVLSLQISFKLFKMASSSFLVSTRLTVVKSKIEDSYYCSGNGNPLFCPPDNVIPLRPEWIVSYCLLKPWCFMHNRILSSCVTTSSMLASSLPNLMLFWSRSENKKHLVARSILFRNQKRFNVLISLSSILLGLQLHHTIVKLENSWLARPVFPSIAVFLLL
jgi:hypothetical protein